MFDIHAYMYMYMYMCFEIAILLGGVHPPIVSYVRGVEWGGWGGGTMCESDTTDSKYTHARHTDHAADFRINIDH